MSGRRWLIVFLGIVLFVGWSSFFIVDEREIVLVTQFGKFKRQVTRPGGYFKLPFVQEVRRFESRILGSDTPPAEFLTLDKKRLVTDPVTRWRIVEPFKFYMTLRNETAAKPRLDDIVNSELRRVLASHEFGHIIGNARDPLMQQVTAKARMQTRKFGIEVVDVRIKRADLPTEVEESVFARMRAERERVAKQYRSEGEEEAAKLRADTDKEKTIILAKVYQEAQQLRGEGDAESIKVYAEAYGKDPEFYSFIQTLDIYKETMDKDSSLVLSTDSEFLKYFKGYKGNE